MHYNKSEYVAITNSLLLGFYIILFSILNSAYIKIINDNNYNFLIPLPLLICGLLNGRYKFLILSILFLPFLFYDLYTYSIILFLLTINSIKNIKIYNFYIVFSILFAIIINLNIDFYYNGGNFLYNDFWGRYRLLLGYYHPKEIGELVVLLILFIPSTNRNIIYLSLLYFIDSRNCLITGFLIVLGRYKKLFIYIFIGLSLLLFISLYLYKRDLLNNILSFRIDYWASSMDSIKRYGIEWPAYYDNSYLTIYRHNPFVIILLFIFLMINKKINSIYFVPMLWYGFFDDGLFSFGAPLTVFLFLFSLRKAVR